MGEVYRATDSKLKREVAIKVLPAAFAADAERLARFEREAQLLAQLNHPNIASIYGLEGVATASAPSSWSSSKDRRPRRAARARADARSTRRSRSRDRSPRRSRKPTRRASSTATSSPQNVKVTPDGKVKVLDFGLAKAMDRAGSGSSRPTSAARRLIELAHPDVGGDAGRRDPRHGRLHGARAGDGAGRRQARRHLGVRRRALRDADGSGSSRATP